MKYFITGGTGFVGKSFTEKLISVLKKGDIVYFLSRNPVSLPNSCIKILIGTLEEISQYANELKECEYVFHIGALATFGSKEEYRKPNYEATKVIVDILKESSVLKNFIFTSTIGAVDRLATDACYAPLTVETKNNPRSSYGKSKLLAEKYILQSSIPFTIIRPTWIYGRNMRAKSHINAFVCLIKKIPLFARFGFKGKVSLIHVDDLSTAIINCVDNQVVIRKVYFGVTESLSLGKIFSVISDKLYKKQITQITIPNFSFIFRKYHSLFPLLFTNLFIDYLCAEDKRFIDDMKIDKPKCFTDGVTDVIDTNSEVSGYWAITGANSGIGLALARMLNKKGKRLVLVDKDTDKMSTIEGAVIVKTDLADEKSIETLSGILKKYKLYCLINNAGIGFKKSIHDVTIQEILLTLKINVIAPVLIVKKLLPELKKDGTRIVNISSTIAFNPLPGMSFYSSSKAMLLNWSESLRYELSKTNKVITFCPSGTNTNFQRNSSVKVLNDGKGLLDPDYVASEIIKAAEKGKAEVTLGVASKILIHISKFLPVI